MKVFHRLEEFDKSNNPKVVNTFQFGNIISIDYSEFFTVIETCQTKTHTYHIISKNSEDIIGTIKWNGAWRKYCFFPNNDTVWDIKCLTTITQLIQDITEQYKNSKNKEGY